MLQSVGVFQHAASARFSASATSRQQPWRMCAWLGTAATNLRQNKPKKRPPVRLLDVIFQSAQLLRKFSDSRATVRDQLCLSNLCAHFSSVYHKVTQFTSSSDGFEAEIPIAARCFHAKDKVCNELSESNGMQIACKV